MTNPKDPVELAFQVELETRKLTRGLSDVDRALRKAASRKLEIKMDTKGVKGLNEELETSAESISEMEKAFKTAWKPFHRIFDRKGIQDVSKAFESSKKASVAFSKGIQVEYAKVGKARAAFEAASTDDAKAAAASHLKMVEESAAKELKVLRGLYKERDRELHTRLKETKLSQVFEVQLNFDQAAERFKYKAFGGVDKILGKDVGKDIAGGFEDTLESFKGKDFFGFLRGSNKMVSSLLKGAGGVSKKVGGALQDKGISKGGLAGGGMQALGGLISKMGPMLNTLAKIGPLAATMSAAIMGVVKLLIDVEARMKEMNKEVLEGAATADLYGSQMFNVAKSMEKLDGILENVRDEATDVRMNLQMGTSAKDHLQVIGVLAKEGETLKTMNDRLASNKERADALSQSMSKFSDVTSMAIGFSRLFGVSVEEVASFQSEMMHELGTSLSDTKLEFARMTKSAVESGIAANKFFSILRGVSSDLSLYGVRLGEVTKMLKQMGKAMSPRSAEKMVKSFAQGMKGMSSDEALKMVLLGGPTAVSDIKKDLEGQKKDIISSLATETGFSGAEAESLLKGERVRGKTLSSLAAEGKVKDVGTKREAYQNAIRGQNQLAQGGLYGAGMAAKGASGFAAYQIKKRAALRLSGSKDLEGSIGLRGEKSAEVAGFGGEKFDELLGQERALKQQSQDLLSAVTSPEPTKEEQEMLIQLQKMGVINAKMSQKEQAAAVSAMSENKVWQSLDAKTSEDQKSDADKMLDAAKEQGQRTQTMIDKLDVIMDALFNWIYKVMLKIWDSVENLNPFKGGNEKQRLERSVMGSRSPELQQLLDKSGGDPGAFKSKAILESSTGKALASALSPAQVRKNADLYAKQQEAGKAYSSESDPARKAAAKDVLDKVTSDLEASQASSRGARGKVDEIFSGMSGRFFAGSSAADSARMAGITDEGKISAMHKNLVSNKDMGLSEAAGKAGFSEEEIAKIMQKALWSKAMDVPENIVKLFGGPGGAGTPSMGGSLATGTPTVGATPVAPPQSEGDAKQGEQSLRTQDETLDALRKQGVKMDKTFLEGPFQKSVREGVLDATRKALFEFALYTADDPEARLRKMGDLFGDSAVGGLASNFKESQEASKLTVEKAHAAGGKVMGIAGGRALVAPAGEGLTSIGLGERILPAKPSKATGSPSRAGGVDSNVYHIHVDGVGGADLAKLIERKVNEGVYEYKRREKYN